ncbi:hypothetical protein RUM44_013377 [Polyplax serrata]|uniref:Uncharacterized protein n=1 Tax=Polyplax serrata TaxID=468196 RepID=A0ABR1BEC5_POLSC
MGACRGLQVVAGAEAQQQHVVPSSTDEVAGGGGEQKPRPDQYLSRGNTVRGRTSGISPRETIFPSTFLLVADWLIA